MTREERAVLRKLCEAATPEKEVGPWHVFGAADKALFLAARATLPALLDALDRVEALEARWRDKYRYGEFAVNTLALEVANELRAALDGEKETKR